MYYFYKAGQLHQFPVSGRCGVHYDDEKLWDYVPQGMDECVYCLRNWPGGGKGESGGRVS